MRLFFLNLITVSFFMGLRAHADLTLIFENMEIRSDTQVQLNYKSPDGQHTRSIKDSGPLLMCEVARQLREKYSTLEENKSPLSEKDYQRLVQASSLFLEQDRAQFSSKLESLKTKQNDSKSVIDAFVKYHLQSFEQNLIDTQDGNPNLKTEIEALEREIEGLEAERADMAATLREKGGEAKKVLNYLLYKKDAEIQNKYLELEEKNKTGMSLKSIGMCEEGKFQDSPAPTDERVKEIDAFLEKVDSIIHKNAPSMDETPEKEVKEKPDHASSHPPKNDTPPHSHGENDGAPPREGNTPRPDKTNAQTSADEIQKKWTSQGLTPDSIEPALKKLQESDLGQQMQGAQQLVGQLTQKQATDLLKKLQSGKASPEFLKNWGLNAAGANALVEQLKAKTNDDFSDLRTQSKDSANKLASLAARNEILSRLTDDETNNKDVNTLFDLFGTRPEVGLGFRDEIIGKTSEGAFRLAQLSKSLSNSQGEKLAESLLGEKGTCKKENKTDFEKRLCWAYGEPTTDKGRQFKASFKDALKDADQQKDEFLEWIKKANTLGTDPQAKAARAQAKKKLFENYDQEVLADFIESQLKHGNKDLALMTARALAHEDESGNLELQLQTSDTTTKAPSIDEGSQLAKNRALFLGTTGDENTGTTLGALEALKIANESELPQIDAVQSAKDKENKYALFRKLGAFNKTQAIQTPEKVPNARKLFAKARKLKPSDKTTAASAGDDLTPPELSTYQKPPQHSFESLGKKPILEILKSFGHKPATEAVDPIESPSGPHIPSSNIPTKSSSEDKEEPQKNKTLSRDELLQKLNQKVSAINQQCSTCHGEDYTVLGHEGLEELLDDAQGYFGSETADIPEKMKDPVNEVKKDRDTMDLLRQYYSTAP